MYSSLRGKPASFSTHHVGAYFISFPCSTCKLHRDPLMFAKRYHNDYRFRKVSNRGFIPTASNTKYNCRDCATIQPNKLMCEGQCGLSKPLDHFSKTQRSNGERVSDVVCLQSRWGFPDIQLPGTFRAP